MTLWKHELVDQISDGMWENSSPYGHWRPWCDAVVSWHPTIVGKNFWAQKTNYNLNSNELLSAVGQRMIGMARLVNAAKLLSVTDLESFLHVVNDEMKYRNFQQLPAEPVHVAVLIAALKDETYTRKDLIADLKDMKAIMKLDLPPGV